jgi:ABC-type uncharacterized transport system substrate-binding protein
MEAQMVRRTDRPLLHVLSFEATRFGPQHLIEAYARLVTTVRRASQRSKRGDARPAAGLVSQVPDVIVAAGTPATAILQQLTSTIPIVFERVADPVATGFVASFARPGGNITGFTAAEFSFGGKWLSILKDIAPGTSRVMFLYAPADANWSGYLRALEVAAQSLVISLSPAPVSTAGEIASRIRILCTPA